MPNTNPTIENETDVEYIHRKGRQARKTHVYTMGAITKGREGVELAEMGIKPGARVYVRGAEHVRLGTGLELTVEVPAWGAEVVEVRTGQR